MNISFELPLHGMCVSHIAILHTDPFMDFLNLQDHGIEEMPNVLIIDGVRFRYSGVTDGMGQYQVGKTAIDEKP